MNKSNQDEKGKAKVDEIKDPHKKMWVKKKYSNAQNGSTPEFDDGTSSGNRGIFALGGRLSYKYLKPP